MSVNQAEPQVNSRTFQVLEILREKIQDFPWGVGTLVHETHKTKTTFKTRNMQVLKAAHNVQSKIPLTTMLTTGMYTQTDRQSTRYSSQLRDI